MDNYNGDMFLQLCVLSATVYALMETSIKGFLWRMIDQIAKRLFGQDTVHNDVYAVVYRLVGIGVGIVTAVITPSISFLGVFGFSFAPNAQWIDVVVTGIMLGLGERAIHFVGDTILRDNWKTIAAILKAIQTNKGNQA